MSNKKKDVFVTITHRYQVNPQAADPKRKWEVAEEVQFYEGNVKDRVIQESTVIINYSKKTFVKNRAPSIPMEKYIGHIQKTYSQQWAKFLEITGLEDMVTKQETTEPTDVKPEEEKQE